MQISRLKIEDHKCLVDFDIQMNIEMDQGSSTILIGENGTGKSTMLQTVLEILMSFESDAVKKKLLYNYEIEYYFKGSNIRIHREEEYYHIFIDDTLFCAGTMKTVKKWLERENKSILPERISYFYSGANDRSLDSLKRININYTTECISDIVKYWNALYLAGHEYEGLFPKRRYIYCVEDLVPVYLIALLCGGQTFGKECLSGKCHMTGIDTISVVLDVGKLRPRLQNDIVEIGNEGVCDIIAFIDDRFTDLFRYGFQYQNDEQFVYSLNRIEDAYADSVSIFDLFEKLKTMMDVKLDVYVRIGDTRVNCNDLSEGQRQLIKILGMLDICKNEDALVLMDEPDAHMNPKWKYELKPIIDKCLEGAVNTQALIATHDPMVINGVDNQDIRLFTYNQTIVRNKNFYFTKVIEPTEETKGLGIDGLLQSEYYGMETVLDVDTRTKMDEKHDLMVKKSDGTITDEEKKTLLDLSEELENMAFARNIPTDSYYDEYVAAMHRIYASREPVTLSAEDIAERNAKAEEILRSLMENEVH